jgi:hypothetical protein
MAAATVMAVETASGTKMLMVTATITTLMPTLSMAHQRQQQGKNARDVPHC